jgi:hypothetical protein
VASIFFGMKPCAAVVHPALDEPRIKGRQRKHSAQGGDSNIHIRHKLCQTDEPGLPLALHISVVDVQENVLYRLDFVFRNQGTVIAEGCRVFTGDKLGRYQFTVPEAAIEPFKHGQAVHWQVTVLDNLPYLSADDMMLARVNTIADPAMVEVGNKCRDG